MKVYLFCGMCILCLLLPGVSLAASAKCEVVKKEGTILVMDCGKGADGFKENTKVKIKTDRGKR